MIYGGTEVLVKSNIQHAFVKNPYAEFALGRSDHGEVEWARNCYRSSLPKPK